MIGRGDRVEDLYVLDTTTLVQKFSSNAFMSSSSKFPIHANKASVQTWHSRLGHLSSKRLDCLKSQLQFDFSKFNSGDTDVCYICPLAKQRRLPFVSNNRLSHSPFDLIHCDVWGPHHISAILVTGTLLL